MGEVLIVGAGPAGLALGILLLQAGRKVRVIEQRTSPGEHSRAIGIHPPALEVLDQAGVGRAATQLGVKIRRGVGICRDKVIAELDFTKLPGPHRYILALPQNRTQELLRARLRELDPSALREGVQYLSHRPGTGDDSCQVEVLHRGSARTKTLETGLLVGADGAASAVRASLGMGFTGRSLPDRYVMGDYPDGTDFADTAALFPHPEGIIESFPLPGQRRRWVAHLGQHPHADLPQLVAERTGHQLDATACTMYSRFETANRYTPQMVKNQAILIGDAAHQISPIGGQGMALGLQDAAALAELLSEGQGGTASQLQDFERERLRAARQAGRQARINMMLGRPLPGWLAAGRDSALRALGSQPAIRLAVARKFTMTSREASPN